MLRKIQESKIFRTVSSQRTATLRYTFLDIPLTSNLNRSLIFEKCFVTLGRNTKLTYPDFVFHSLLFASFSGRSNANSAAVETEITITRRNRVRTT